MQGPHCRLTQATKQEAFLSYVLISGDVNGNHLLTDPLPWALTGPDLPATAQAGGDSIAIFLRCRISTVGLSERRITVVLAQNSIDQGGANVNSHLPNLLIFTM